MKYKLMRLVLALTMILGASAVMAQGIAVSEFRLLENDLTANLQGTMQKDHNGGSGSMSDQIFNAGTTLRLNANTFTHSAYTFICWNTSPDGSGHSYNNQQSLKPEQDVTLYAQWKKGNFENGHEWVDLGLPSGIKWATCNVGAITPEGYGDYFAWGETSPKSNYTLETYKFRTSGDSYKNVKFSKYNTKRSHGKVDNKTTLEISDDAARVNWGGNWRMPTYNEWDELKNNCTWTWATQNGVGGYKVTSRTNGNSIFLPAAGDRSGASVYYVGSFGCYWSSSLLESDPSYAYDLLYFSSGDVDRNVSYRYDGRTVRAVCP